MAKEKYYIHLISIILPAQTVNRVVHRHLFPTRLLLFTFGNSSLIPGGLQITVLQRAQNSPETNWFFSTALFLSAVLACACVRYKLTFFYSE